MPSAIAIAARQRQFIALPVPVSGDVALSGIYLVILR
jgi:uncharacterized protein YpuA (DUF1002 family)